MSSPVLNILKGRSNKEMSQKFLELENISRRTSTRAEKEQTVDSVETSCSLKKRGNPPRVKFTLSELSDYKKIDNTEADDIFTGSNLFNKSKASIIQDQELDALMNTSPDYAPKENNVLDMHKIFEDSFVSSCDE